MKLALPSAMRAAAPTLRRAFSIMELMLAVGLMGIIIVALYGMFHHTQKALRSNATQVDVLEAGRATMELLTRDLSQMGPCDLRWGTNFFARLSQMYQVTDPVRQRLIGNNAMRTNLIDDVYFVSRRDWELAGTLYRVFYATNGVGVLCRFSTNMPRQLVTSSNLTMSVLEQPPTNFVQLADRVIHFRVQPYDGYGQLMAWYFTNRYANVSNVSIYTNISLFTNVNVFLTRESIRSETWSAFVSNALPAYVEVELAVLEPVAHEQLKSMRNPVMARDFLSNRVGQVHLFRQRIPIRQSPPQRILH